MKNLIISVALCLFGSLAASATNVSTCTTISAGGTYDVTANITSDGSADCVVISGASTAVTFDCHGNFTISGSAYSGFSLLKLTGNTGTITIRNCTFNEPWSTINRPVLNSQGTNSTFTSNTFTKTFLDVTCSAGQTANVTGNTFVNAYTQVTSCDNSYVGHNNFSGMTSDTGGLIVVRLSNYVLIEYNVGVGGSTSASSSSGTDDIIIVSGASEGVGDQRIFTGAQIRHNTMSHVYDACMEFVGRWSYSTVSDNDCQFYGFAAYSDYHNTSLDNVTFTNNHASNPYGSAGVFDFRIVDTITTANSFFTNNVFTGNIGPATGFSASQFGSGFATNLFSSYSGNLFTGNNFGYSVSFQASAGVIDGGLNACLPGDAVPTGAVKCYPFPFNIPGGFLP